MKLSAFFNGSNNLTVANYTGNPSAYSVSAWVKLAIDQTTRVIYSNFQPTGSKGFAVGISDVSTNKIKFYLGGTTLTSSTALTSGLGVWTLVCCTHDVRQPRFISTTAAPPMPRQSRRQPMALCRRTTR